MHEGNSRKQSVAQSFAAVAPALQKSGPYVFLISFLCVFYVSNATLLLSHYDLGWHLAAGDLIRHEANIPYQDPWAFTLGDKRWYNLSWLWDVVASLLYQRAGLVGLVCLVVTCGAIIVGYLTSACLGSGASPIATCVAVFAACILYPAYETAPNIYLAASPNVATMLFCVAFYRQCLRRTRLLLLPLMMVFWVNLHGGFVLGFPIIAVFGCVALLERDWRNAKAFTLAGIGCLAATFINPLGWHIYEGVTATLGHFVQANISEWLPYYRNIEIPGSIPGLVYVLVFVALELSRGAVNGARLEPRILSWIFLGLGLYQFRYMSFFFIFSTIPLALHLDRLLARWPAPPQVQGALWAAAIIGACALPITAMRVQPALDLPDMLSERDAGYLRAHLSHARVLNHWNTGGLLIFRTQGEVPVFVDGRAATAYPDELLRDYFKLVRWKIDESDWDAVLEKYHIDAVLWVKGHDELRRFLVEKRHWKEDYTGAYESVYVRPDATPQSEGRDQQSRGSTGKG
ncbi:hypothetical protein [Bradyrhizobium sp.]|uniref:hypothetical protein n=1 Tax=Bradyrhizobium sp. TaxID=376 RepID=UPI0039E6FB42